MTGCYRSNTQESPCRQNLISLLICKHRLPWYRPGFKVGRALSHLRNNGVLIQQKVNYIFSRHRRYNCLLKPDQVVAWITSSVSLLHQRLILGSTLMYTGRSDHSHEQMQLYYKIRDEKISPSGYQNVLGQQHSHRSKSCLQFPYILTGIATPGRSLQGRHSLKLHSHPLSIAKWPKYFRNTHINEHLNACNNTNCANKLYRFRYVQAKVLGRGRPTEDDIRVCRNRVHNYVPF